MTTKHEVPPPIWQAQNCLNILLEENAIGDFNGKNIIVPDAEKTMKARPQFAFGVAMTDIPNLFKMLIDGPKGDDEQLSLNYGSEPQTLEEYGRENIGTGLATGNDKANSIFEEHDTGEANLEPESKGFVHYLVYYINQMRTKEYASKDTTVAGTKSVHIAQILLEALELRIQAIILSMEKLIPQE